MDIRNPARIQEPWVVDQGAPFIVGVGIGPVAVVAGGDIAWIGRDLELPIDDLIGSDIAKHQGMAIETDPSGRIVGIRKGDGVPMTVGTIGVGGLGVVLVGEIGSVTRPSRPTGLMKDLTRLMALGTGGIVHDSIVIGAMAFGTSLRVSIVDQLYKGGHVFRTIAVDPIGLCVGKLGMAFGALATGDGGWIAGKVSSVATGRVTAILSITIGGETVFLRDSIIGLPAFEVGIARMTFKTGLTRDAPHQVIAMTELTTCLVVLQGCEDIGPVTLVVFPWGPRVREGGMAGKTGLSIFLGF